MRNEKGLLVYDDDFRRRFMTPKEIELNDDWVKKHGALIDAKERNEISAQEYERLCDKLDAEHDAERKRLRDKKFADVTNTDAKNFFTPPIFANA